MTLAAQIDHLRTLAVLDPETTLLQRAVIEVLAELAEAVDGLTAQQPPEHGMGSV